MSGKVPIPTLPGSTIGTDRQRLDEALSHNLRLLIGQSGGKLTPLPATATLADVVAKVNEIIERLQ